MNIYLQQNSANNVYLTLREKSLLWTYSSITPYYLFNFISPTTKQTIAFVSDNLAPFSAQDSYDLFNIITTGATAVNYSAGTIHLNPGMFWNYKVYEQLNQFNFDVANTISEVENGKVQFSGAVAIFQYVKATGNTNYIAVSTYQQ